MNIIFGVTMNEYKNTSHSDFPIALNSHNSW